MTSINFGDELVRDFLVYRGFLTALKAFDSEVKTDKDRGFRPDRIVEHLSSCITNLDFTALREAWSHLEQRVFSRLEHSFLGTAKKLENALLRMYLVTCISAGRQDKLLDFFEKMTPELQGQSEWKDWFALPFLKNPDENPTFSVFFSRQWQDTMLVSLYNFISVVFQSIAMPSLLNYEEELLRHTTLQEENEMLKSKLSSLKIDENDRTRQISDLDCQGIAAPVELMDDFYVIAQEAPSENVGRSIKTLIKNIGSGLPTSPILGRHMHESRRQEDFAGTSKTSRLKPRSPSVPAQPLSSSASVESAYSRKDVASTKKVLSKVMQDENLKESDSKTASNFKTSSSSSPFTSLPAFEESKGGFLVLSQEEYPEHHSFITHCKFNCSGSVVATSDLNGIIKIWNASPSPQTISTIMSKSSVLALEWATKRERLLLHGSYSGKIRLYDTKERKLLGEVCCDSKACDRVMCISCSPTENCFVVSATSNSQSQLCVWDMRTLQMEHQLSLASKSAYCCCCSFNHNGQLLLVGMSDGNLSIFDMRSYEVIASWSSRDDSAYEVQFSADETSCYTLGKANKIVQWSMNKTGHCIGEFPLHAGAVGPFGESRTGLSSEYLPVGKQFAFNNDGNHILTCGPTGGVIYKIEEQNLTQVLNIGGHQHAVSTVDWSTALECSTCLCGSVDGKITVTTLLWQ